VEHRRHPGWRRAGWRARYEAITEAVGSRGDGQLALRAAARKNERQTERVPTTKRAKHPCQSTRDLVGGNSNSRPGRAAPLSLALLASLAPLRSLPLGFFTGLSATA